MTSSSPKPNGHFSLSLFEFLPVSTFLTTITLPHGGAACVISSLHRKVGENCCLLGCPETSIRIHHYSLRNNPEVRNSQRFPTSVVPISASCVCMCVCIYIYIVRTKIRAHYSANELFLDIFAAIFYFSRAVRVYCK
jgi:hypothetical protein